MNITHAHRRYKQRWESLNRGRWNGAYYYSREIVDNIIPNVKTDRSWITVNLPGVGCDHAIVFVHNNLHPENYEWLKKYNDIIFVCGVPETCEKVAHLGKTIYLPLSIDVEEVTKHKIEKRRGKAYAGRATKRRECRKNIPRDAAMVESLPRSVFLDELAKYEEVYAVGRTAIEAKALGAKILPYDPRFPDPEIWQVLDNREAAKILQEKLDDIDNRRPEDLKVIDHTRPEYKWRYNRLSEANKHNGAYYYSKEIVKNIIPNVKTDRPWVTIKAGNMMLDRAIVFIHNNVAFEKAYDYIRPYDDLILVVGLPDMVERVRPYGTPIYLPLSVDVEEVAKHRRKKTKGKAFVGRYETRRRSGVLFGQDTDYIEGLPREQLLDEMAKYEQVYAIGRTAIEAKVLGCEILPFHPRLQDVSMWKILDNKDAAKMLQAELDKIDGKQEEPSMDWLKADLIKYAEENNIFVDKRDTKAMILQKVKVNTPGC